MEQKPKQTKETTVLDVAAAILALIIVAILSLSTSGCSRATFNTSELACRIVDDSIVCPNGVAYPLPKDGRDGAPGAPGLNGVDGVDGRDGQDGVADVAIVYPCPGVDPLREVLIKVGSLYFAHLTMPPPQGRLVQVPENQLFQTVGPESCRFTIIDGQVVTQ
jgi:hypothetical protein